MDAPRGSHRLMYRRIANALVGCALILIIGGHWAVLQSVAWVGMAIEYSSDSSLTVAIEKTFGGQHPCKVCRLVQEGKKAEKQAATPKPDSKILFCLAPAAFSLSAPTLACTAFRCDLDAAARPASPQMQPPRIG